MSSPHLQFTRSTHIIMSLSHFLSCTTYHSTSSFSSPQHTISSYFISAHHHVWGGSLKIVKFSLRIYSMVIAFYNPGLNYQVLLGLVVAPWLPHIYFTENSLSLALLLSLMLFYCIWQAALFPPNLKHIWHSNLKYTILHSLYISSNTELTH